MLLWILNPMHSAHGTLLKSRRRYLPEFYRKKCNDVRLPDCLRSDVSVLDM